MDPKAILGSNIIRIRKFSNLTQTALAAKIKITRKHLSKIERGEAFPSAEILSLIAEGLEVPLSELFAENNSGIMYDVYSSSQRVFEKLLPRITKELSEEITKEVYTSIVK